MKTKGMKRTGCSRRDFLKAAGIGCSAVAFGGPLVFVASPARAADTFTGTTYLTPAYNCLMRGINKFNEILKEKGQGILKVDFHDSGTLVKADEQMAALRAGTIQYMFHTASYITRSLKILGVTGLPSLCEELYEHGDRLKMESPLWKLMNDSMAKENIFMLTQGGGVLEPEYIWSGAGKKISSLKDLQGSKIRVVGYEATEALKPYGVASVRVPSAETYLALQRGTVDGAVANISTVVGRRLFEQIKYCYKLPVTAFTIAVYLLKDRWDKLDGKSKAVFWDAGKWFDENYAKEINTAFYNREYWPMLKQGGLEVVDPSEADLKDFDAKSRPVWDWWKKEVGETMGQKAIDYALGKV